MTTFDKWLSEDKEYRDKHNPFLEMFSQSLKSLPQISRPKDFEQLKREGAQEDEQQNKRYF